jgi:hypothetical protein
MNAQMRLVIMLTSVAVSGTILFAAEPAPRAEKPAAAASKEQPAPTQKPDETAKAAAADDKGEPEQKAQTPAAEKAPTPPGEKAPTPAAEDEDPAPKRAGSAADKAGSPQRFNPSEQVRADFDVSFPIDI